MLVIVGVPTRKNGQVVYIHSNLCCYTSLQSQHSTDFKSASTFFVSVSVDFASVCLKQYFLSVLEMRHQLIKKD